MRLLIDIKDLCDRKDLHSNFHMGAMLVYDDWERSKGYPCGYTDLRNFSEAKAAARYEMLARKIEKLVDEFYSSEETEVMISTKSE